MAGRPPTPTALKVLRGNPGRRPLNVDEPKPPIPDQVPPCPAWLGPEGRAFWRQQAPIHHQLGTLTAVDIPAFTALAATWDGWRKDADSDTLRCWIKLCNDFGMTPAARTRIRAHPPDAHDDPIQAFTRARPVRA